MKLIAGLHVLICAKPFPNYLAGVRPEMAIFTDFGVGLKF